MQSKHIKMLYQEIPLIGNHSSTQEIPHLLCAPSLYTDYLPELHKKFHLVSAYVIIVTYQIQNFYYNLFLNYADNTYTYTQINL